MYEGGKSQTKEGKHIKWYYWAWKHRNMVLSQKSREALKISKSTLFIHPKLKPPRAFLPTLGGIKRTQGFWFWMSKKGTF